MNRVALAGCTGMLPTKERIVRTTTFLFAVVALVGSDMPGSHHARAAEVKTSKERLSDKAADEQRVDNCRVPVERRGSVPRPACADEKVPPATATDRDSPGPQPPR